VIEVEIDLEIEVEVEIDLPAWVTTWSRRSDFPQRAARPRR